SLRRVRYRHAMITAVDSTILLDALDPGSVSHLLARRALHRAGQHGRLVASDPVWAEVRARFSAPHAFASAIADVGVEFDGLGRSSAFDAGRIWRLFRHSAGRRERIPVDFLVGAHALGQADRLLTYPRGFFRRYFRSLRLMEL
ncbi:MAG: hypothetical protein A3J29_19250, partial [Acidobacteria bacterium RIFCSPLOWO2_12_FULL_67_14b]